MDMTARYEALATRRREIVSEKIPDTMGQRDLESEMAFTLIERLVVALEDIAHSARARAGQ